jgi:hypothetical protein
VTKFKATSKPVDGFQPSSNAFPVGKKSKFSQPAVIITEALLRAELPEVLDGIEQRRNAKKSE